MPHEFESGVFTEGKPAWHGLGVVLPNDALDSVEALQYSGLAGWDLTKQPIYTGNPEDGYRQVADHFAVTRATDGRALGVVGHGYRIVQNEEAFAWCDLLLGGEGFHYKTAGSLRSGQVTWLLAQAPFQLDLPDSRVDMYVMLTNTHDGSGAVTACATPVRVVCMNTLRAALRGAQATYKIRHTSGAQARLAEAQRVLGLTRGAAERVQQRAEELASTGISDSDFHAFLDALVPDPPDSRPGQTRAENVRTDISRIYYGDRYGQQGVRGTAWGAWQAVVAYNDHGMTSRRTRTSTAAETRFERILGGDNIGSRALALLS
jgi:phage/plasmid-like protein (TIGR03299 family)